MLDYVPGLKEQTPVKGFGAVLKGICRVLKMILGQLGHTGDKVANKYISTSFNGLN